jgi:hypothetical protein
LRLISPASVHWGLRVPSLIHGLHGLAPAVIVSIVCALVTHGLVVISSHSLKLKRNEDSSSSPSLVKQVNVF